MKKRNYYGYILIYMPNHPKAFKSNGCVFEHVLVAEKMIGRHIVSEHIHHIDHDPTNNSPENLMIFKTSADHGLYHAYGNAIEVEPHIFISIRPEEKHCALCDKIINRNNKKYCADCASISARKVKDRPTKEELEILILNNTIVYVSKIYGVSDNTIRKWCKKYGINYKKEKLKKQNHIPKEKVNYLENGFTYSLTKEQVDEFIKNYIPRDSNFGMRAFSRKFGLKGHHVLIEINRKIKKEEGEQKWSE